MTGRADIGVPVALATTLLLWAAAFVGIRAGLEAYAPADLVLLRFLVASATLAAYARRQSRWRSMVSGAS